MNEVIRVVISIRPIPTNRKLALTMTRAGVRGTIYARDADGQVYYGGRYYEDVTLGESQIDKDILKALKRLGVVTQEQIDQHIEDRRASDELEAVQKDADDLKDICSRYGIALSAMLLRKIKPPVSVPDTRKATDKPTRAQIRRKVNRVSRKQKFATL